MANEAVIVELLGDAGNPVRYTIADSGAIAKGTLLKLSGDRTVIASTGIGPMVCAGIAASEKVANDGQTTLGAYTYGIFDLKVDVASTFGVGSLVCLSAANLIISADKIGTAADAYLSGAILGKALEAGTASDTITVKVNL